MMDKQESRIRYIDYVKGIGIALIVLYHATGSIPALDRFTGYLSGFNVTLFFIAGGCLNYYIRESTSFKAFAGKKARTLLIPYVIFSVFNSAIKLIVLLIRKQLTVEIFKAEMLEFLVTGNGTVWFLPVYFAISLIFFWLLRKNSRVLLVLTFVISLIVPYITTAYLKGSGIVLLNRTLSGLAYYIMGFCLAGLLERTGLKNGWHLVIGTVCFILGTLCYYFFGVPYSLFFWKGHFSNFASSTGSSVLICIGIVLLAVSADRFNKRNLEVLSWYGRNSLLVMLIHPTVLLCFTQTCGILFGAVQGLTAAIVAAFLFLFIMLLDVPLVNLINRRFPWVLGKKPERQMELIE